MREGKALMAAREEYAAAMFHKYRNMIRKKAWKVAKAYYLQNLELTFKELCSDGYLIFLQTLEMYDETQGSFSTYLSERLKGIADLHFRENKDITKMDYDSFALEEFDATSFDAFQQTLELQQCADTELSEDAQKVLDYIISNPDKRHTENSIRTYFRQNFNWSVKKAEMSFAELQRWWLCFTAA